MGVRTIGDVAALDEAALVARARRVARPRTCTRSRATTTRARSCPSATRSRSAPRRRSPPICAPSPRATASSCGSPTASCARLRHAGLAARTVTLKIRFGDFETRTRARTLAEPTDVSTVVLDDGARAARASSTSARGVRLLGVSLSQLDERGRRRQDDARRSTTTSRDRRRARSSAGPRSSARSTRCATASARGAVGPATLVEPSARAGGRDDPDRARRLRPHRHRARVRAAAARRRGARRRALDRDLRRRSRARPRGSRGITAASRPPTLDALLDARRRRVGVHVDGRAPRGRRGRGRARACPSSARSRSRPTSRRRTRVAARARAGAAPGRARAALGAGVPNAAAAIIVGGEFGRVARDRHARRPVLPDPGLLRLDVAQGRRARGRRHADRALDPRHRRAALAARRPGRRSARAPRRRFGHPGIEDTAAVHVRVRRRLGRAAHERVAPGADRASRAAASRCSARRRCSGPTTTTSGRCTSRPTTATTTDRGRAAGVDGAAHGARGATRRRSRSTPSRRRRSSTRWPPGRSPAVGHPPAAEALAAHRLVDAAVPLGRRRRRARIGPR